MISGEILWTFHGYVSKAGKRLIQEWFDGLPESAKDEFRDTVLYLEHLPMEAWCRPPFATLEDGLSELRAKDHVEKKTYRIYGFFWPHGKRYQYTLLHGTNKKVNNDKKGKREALTRLKQVVRGEVNIHEFSF